MNKLVLYSILLLSGFLRSQENLVPNGSFEEFWQCPVGNDLNDGQFERCKYWWKPTTSGTADYFNECHTGGIVGVPNNFWGYQEAFHGKGYVGILPLEGLIATGEEFGRELIQTKLQKSLKACTRYKAGMYISLANKSKYGFSNIGMLFSKDSIYLSDSVIYANPQIFWDKSPIVDTLNWVKITGEFVANGYENFLTIGYFQKEINSDTFQIQAGATEWQENIYGYFYIDSVSLIEIEEVESCDLNLPNVFSPNNDGVNDFYDLSIFTSFQDIDFSIINRWGNVVFEYNSSNQVWNGDDKNGNKCPDGVYYYILNTDIINKTGFIQLIR